MLPSLTDPSKNKTVCDNWGAAAYPEKGAAQLSEGRLAIWTAKEATIKAAGATLAELEQVQLRGRGVRFRGRSWHCRTPRLAAPLIVRVVTERRITQLLLRPMPCESALAA